MTIAQTSTTSFKVELLQAVHNFGPTTPNTFKIALYTAAADINADTTIYTTSIAVYPRLKDAPSIRRPARPPVPRAHRAVHPGSPLPRFPTATPPQPSLPRPRFPTETSPPPSIPRPPGFARPPHGSHPRRRHTRPSSRRPLLATDPSGIRLGLPPHPAMGPRARRICCHASGPRSPGRH